MIEDGCITKTSRDQHALELRLLSLYSQQSGSTSALTLLRSEHVQYLHGGLGELPAGFASLDAGRPWICYWVVHSLLLLRAPLPESVSPTDIVCFLDACQDANGGFGGGPGQLPHLAPTYAAVATLVSMGSEAALGAINRRGVLRFIGSMCLPPEAGGGLSVCQGGEVDCRGCYTAMATLHMLGLDVEGLVARSGMVSFVQRCQTYEGGLGGEPGSEAHGGYTFCGLAALQLAGAAHALDLPRLLHWAVHRQGLAEGGFMGRTNKLVDGCYSFWQGALFPLLQLVWPEYLRQAGIPVSPSAPPAPGPLPQLDIRGLPPLSAQPPREQAAAETQLRKVDAQQLLGRCTSALDPSTSCGDRSHVEALLSRAAEAQSGVARAADYERLMQVGAAALTPIGARSGREDHDSGLDSSEGITPAPLYNSEALRLWLLKCCQASRGGLRDKPGKPVDYYHTCYCLSGYAASLAYDAMPSSSGDSLAAMDPLCNILTDKLAAARAFFSQLPA